MWTSQEGHQKKPVQRVNIWRQNWGPEVIKRFVPHRHLSQFRCRVKSGNILVTNGTPDHMLLLITQSRLLLFHSRVFVHYDTFAKAPQTSLSSHTAAWGRGFPPLWPWVTQRWRGFSLWVAHHSFSQPGKSGPLLVPLWRYLVSFSVSLHTLFSTPDLHLFFPSLPPLDFPCPSLSLTVPPASLHRPPPLLISESDSFPARLSFLHPTLHTVRWALSRHRLFLSSHSYFFFFLSLSTCLLPSLARSGLGCLFHFPAAFSLILAESWDRESPQ